MHCRYKEHVSNFNSKSEKIRSESPFYKHLLNTHGGKEDEKEFSEYFEVQILKAYQKPFTRLVVEGTYITSHKGELLNSKSEWHQAKVVRTRTQVVQGGVEVVQHQHHHHHRGGGGVGGGREGVQVQGVGGQGGQGGQGEGRGRTLGGRAAGRSQGQ